MIKFKVKTKRGEIIGLGLSKENTERLHKNQPIFIEGEKLQIPFDILIVADENELKVIDSFANLGFDISEKTVIRKG